MTQKELLYFEDAVGHEKNVISIIKESLELLESEDLISFMEEQLEEHKDMEEKLMNLLKENANEW